MRPGNRPALLVAPLLLCLVLTACRTQPSASFHSDEGEAVIRDVLEEQVAAWNGGNIPAFMETYVRSDQLRFSSGDTTRNGWETTLERYVARYPTREAMGQLRFEELEILILSPQWAEAFGRFRLQRGGEYPDATGLFTLLLQRTKEGWKIVHDHTSAAEP